MPACPVTGHHVFVDFDGVVPLEFNVGDRLEKRRIRILTQGQNQGISFQFFELARWLRPAVFIEFHDLDLEGRLVDCLDRAQPVDAHAFFHRLVCLEVMSGH